MTTSFRTDKSAGTAESPFNEFRARVLYDTLNRGRLSVEAENYFQEQWGLIPQAIKDAVCRKAAGAYANGRFTA